MSNQTQNFAGATTWEINQPGSYFTTLATNLGINVRFYKGGAQLSQSQITGLLAGLEVDFTKQAEREGGAVFDRVRIDVLGADTVGILISDGSVRYNRAAGSVSITNTGGVKTHTQASVTNAAQTIKAANAARRSLFVQNNSATAVLRLRVDGTAASATIGTRIQPGQGYEEPAYCATGAISAFMETADATANNVEITEG